MQITLHHVQEESEDIRTFFFEAENPIHYTAGQYIQMTIKHPHPDDRGEQRWFTLSSSPSDKYISVTTRITPKNGSSFKKALSKLQPGDSVQVSSPQGDFVLPKFIQTPVIFVAGGIGITPFHSILSWLHQTKESRPIKFLYSVRSEDDIIFMETCKKAGVLPTIIVSEPDASWGGERGHVTAEMIIGIEKPSADTLIYLSGPEPMVASLVKDLEKEGIDRQQIITDSFPNYTEV